MLAIDTNVLVRYLTADHPEQSSKARALIDNHDVYVSRTVMLESEWVLRSVYGYSGVDTGRALRAFAGLPRVVVEAPALLAAALDQAEAGMDFADALHLGASGDCEAMMTFDQNFIKTARAAGLLKVKQP
jgi:predicted nucleic acid-binding protein